MSSDNKKRIVITGLGAVSPIGTGVDIFWSHLLSGKVGTNKITRFDTSCFHTHTGGEVKDFKVADYAKNHSYEAFSPSVQFALGVTGMTLKDSGILDADINLKRVGIYFGTVIGNRPSLETTIRELYKKECLSLNQTAIFTAHDVTLISRLPAIEFGLRGPNLVTPTACAAGNNAIALAMDAIRTGKADAMIAGGVDELSETMFMMFNSFRSLAPEVVQPFDKNRKGLILSEGAGALLLESYEHAKRRGAFIYGEVLGYGNYSDAYHMTIPHPDGLGAVRSMQDALKRSMILPKQVDYISAHGTGTPVNDAIESKAIQTVFGELTKSVPVSSIKSMLGHMQGAASAIEAVACILAINNDIVPPNMNYKEYDPECALDIVANMPRQHKVDIALSNAFGFGGNISCLVFAKFRD
jgi:3-oxoacyl-[acyl-carrier-protein] synthase II